MAYLDTYMHDELIEGFQIFPGFTTPSTQPTVKDVLDYVQSVMPQETPVAFGLHNNAEIGFRMKQVCHCKGPLTATESHAAVTTWLLSGCRKMAGKASQ